MCKVSPNSWASRMRIGVGNVTPPGLESELRWQITGGWLVWIDTERCRVFLEFVWSDGFWRKGPNQKEQEKGLCRSSK